MDLKAINYHAAGHSFTGYMADGSRGRPVPGILVAHEGGGMTDHPKDRALKLAELGYVAFALDLFGEENQELEKAKIVVQELRADRALLRLRMHAAYDVLKAYAHVDCNRMAAIGFCIGGMAVLELARSGADIAGIVGFHAALDTSAPQDANHIKGKVLVCLGVDDPIVTAEQRRAFEMEMSEAGVDWQMLVFGNTCHSFTNPEIDALNFPGFSYSATADQRSWKVMCDFLDELFQAQ